MLTIYRLVDPTPRAEFHFHFSNEQPASAAEIHMWSLPNSSSDGEDIEFRLWLLISFQSAVFGVSKESESRLPER